MKTRTGVGRCCCGAADICGCTNVDNHTDDYTTDTIDTSGWELVQPSSLPGTIPSDLFEVVDGQLWHRTFEDEGSFESGGTNTLQRCVVLPTFDDKKVVIELTIGTVTDWVESWFSIIHNSGANPLDPCPEKVYAGVVASLAGANGYYWDSTAGFVDFALIVATDPSGSVIRFEIERVTSPSIVVTERWFVDGIEEHSRTLSISSTFFDVAQANIKLGYRWEELVTHKNSIDDFYFGVEDV